MKTTQKRVADERADLASALDAEKAVLAALNLAVGREIANPVRDASAIDAARKAVAESEARLRKLKALDDDLKLAEPFEKFRDLEVLAVERATLLESAEAELPKSLEAYERAETAYKAAAEAYAVAKNLRDNLAQMLYSTKEQIQKFRAANAAVLGENQ